MRVLGEGTVDKQAFVVMDVQEGIVERFGGSGAYLEGIRQVVAAARNAGVAVFFVRVGFRPGYPEIHPNNRSFRTMRERSAPLGDVHPDLDVRPDDIIVTKKRVSAFSGSDLDMLLRAGGISRLVLAGIATSGVVLSTVREAADRDYVLTVLADGCLDADEEVHRVLIEKIFPRQADVISISSWIESLS